MAREDRMEINGIVTKVLKGSNFVVTVDMQGSKMDLNCNISGKLRINKIKILLNDTVTIAVSPYDLTRGTIIWRGILK